MTARRAGTGLRSKMAVGVALLATLLCGCGEASRYAAIEPDRDLGLRIELLSVQTIEGLGAQQGVEVRDGLVYLYGDNQRRGVVRQFKYILDPAPLLEWTGVELVLRRGGEELVTHPTGFTFHPEHGTFVGDTVRRRGVIHHIDFDALLRDGTLDNALLNSTVDEIAINGTRPEFVRFRGAWLIATSDYGPKGNEVRLYDPERLKVARSTAEPDVLVERFPCGPWVQSLHWIDHLDVLALVQNQEEGLGWRITFVELEPGTDLRRYRPVDLDPGDELEGWHLLDDRETAIFTTAMRRNNLRIGRLVAGER